MSWAKTSVKVIQVGEVESEVDKIWVCLYLGGGFKDFLFSPLLGEMIQFD